MGKGGFHEPGVWEQTGVIGCGFCLRNERSWGELWVLFQGSSPSMGRDLIFFFPWVHICNDLCTMYFNFLHSSLAGSGVDLLSRYFFPITLYKEKSNLFTSFDDTDITVTTSFFSSHVPGKIKTKS